VVNARDACQRIFGGHVYVDQHVQRGTKFSMVNVSAEGQVFKCEICGNVVIVKEAGGGELICCGEPMKLESE